jgi:MGT family glycosyltransferase
MSKVIYFSVTLHGHVNPSLGLIKKLVERGEEVCYYSSEEFRQKIEGTGARFMSYREMVDFGTYDGDGIDAFLVFADFILGKSKVIIDNFIEEIKAFGPDYIIHDTFCFWGRAISGMLGIPGIAVFANFAFTAAMADMYPEFFMENILRAAENPLYKRNKGNADICRIILDKLSWVTSMKYGIKDLNVIDDIFCSREKLNILFTSKDFQLYSEAFDDSYLFIGPSISPRVEPTDFPWDKLGKKPLIYMALGTIFNDRPHVYRNCIEAFADTDKQVVLSVGNKVRLDKLGDIPDNFIVRNFVPQLEILKHADVFITHGGANSINEGLCCQVPMVVVPQAFDQFMGAIMVERAGAGIYLRNSEPEARELEEAVGKVLEEEPYKDNCMRIRESFESAGNLEYAVDEIFKFTNKKIRINL